jgi:hypothetical protein
MADWTTIPDSSLEPGKPIRAIDGLALRDNPIAIAQGAVGAPRIATAALFPPSAGDAHIIMRLQEEEISGAFANYQSVFLHNRFSHSSHLGVTVLVPGVIRCSLRHRVVQIGDPSEVRVLRNGAVVQTWSTLSTANQTRVVDVAVNVGDAIIFQQRTSTVNQPNLVAWSQLRILSATPNMAVA